MQEADSCGEAKQMNNVYNSRQRPADIPVPENAVYNIYTNPVGNLKIWTFKGGNRDKRLQRLCRDKDSKWKFEGVKK